MFWIKKSRTRKGGWDWGWGSRWLYQGNFHWDFNQDLKMKILLGVYRGSGKGDIWGKCQETAKEKTLRWDSAWNILGTAKASMSARNEYKKKSYLGWGQREGRGPDHVGFINLCKDLAFYSKWNQAPFQISEQRRDMVLLTF